MFAILVLLVGWAAYYVQDKGFTHQWRDMIMSEFEKRGVHATIRRLNLDPLRGLIARDVAVYEDPEHKILLMSISQIALDIDPVKLLSGSQSMRAFEVRNAQVTIPLDPQRKHKGEQLKLDNLSARTLMRPDHIEIVRAQAILEGLEVSVSGSLFRPGDVQETPEKEAEDKKEPAEVKPTDNKDHLKILRDRRQSIASVLDYLKRFEFSDEAKPTLEVRVDGDMANLPELRAAGDLKSGPFRYAGHSNEAVHAQFEWANERLIVHELNLEDRFGKLLSRMEYDPSEKILGFSLKSSTDLHGQLSAAFRAPRLGEVVFYRPPLIEASGTCRLDGEFSWENMPLDIIGSVRSDHLTSRGVIFEAMSFDFSANGRELYIRNGRIEHKTGVLDCHILRDSNGVRFRSTAQLDPTIFKPFVRLKGNENFLNRWSFNNDSGIYIKFQGNGPSLDPTTWSSTGVIDLRNCQLNGHPISELQCELQFEGNVHEYRNVVISRPEGSVTGEHIIFDHGSQTCYLEDVAGKVLPVHAVGWFAPKAAQQLLVYDFAEPPEFSIEGTIDCRPGSELARSTARHDYEFSFKSDADASYELFGQVMQLSAPSGTVQIKENSILLSDFKTGTLGGDISASVVLTDIHRVIGYEVDLGVNNIDFRQLAELYSSYKETEGHLSGTMRFEGKGIGIEHLKATGSAVIVDGNVFSIPAFGPLSKPIQEVLPKLHGDFSVAREANLAFEIADSKFYTRDFQAKTNTFQMKGSGSVDLVTQELDFEAGLNLRGAPGLLFAPVAKLLVFKGEGSVSQPTWRAKNMPGMVTNKALKELGDITENALRKAGELHLGPDKDRKDDPERRDRFRNKAENPTD
tara:strand:+ start:11307 stop:13871 length:2565 start_codon:yes stop_codon:yes gene_type:complete